MKRAQPEGQTRSPSTSSIPKRARSRSWRWRRCPSCGKVEPASAYTVAETFSEPWLSGSMLRACTNCGRTGETKSIPVVRERHR